MPSNFYSRWMKRMKAKTCKLVTLHTFNYGLSMKREKAHNSDITEGTLRGLLMLYDCENSESDREKSLKELTKDLRLALAKLP